MRKRTPIEFMEDMLKAERTFKKLNKRAHQIIIKKTLTIGNREALESIQSDLAMIGFELKSLGIHCPKAFRTKAMDLFDRIEDRLEQDPNY